MQRLSSRSALKNALFARVERFSRTAGARPCIHTVEIINDTASSRRWSAPPCVTFVLALRPLDAPHREHPNLSDQVGAMKERATRSTRNAHETPFDFFGDHPKDQCRYLWRNPASRMMLHRRVARQSPPADRCVRLTVSGWIRCRMLSNTRQEEVGFYLRHFRSITTCRQCWTYANVIGAARGFQP